MILSFEDTQCIIAVNEFRIDIAKARCAVFNRLVIFDFKRNGEMSRENLSRGRKQGLDLTAENGER